MAEALALRHLVFSYSYEVYLFESGTVDDEAVSVHRNWRDVVDVATVPDSVNATDYCQFFLA